MKDYAAHHPKSLLGSVVSFLQRVARSCYDLEFYRGVRLKPWASALTYQLLLQAIVAVIATAVFVPAILDIRRDAINLVKEKVPADAGFSVRDGQISTTLTPPFELRAEDFQLLVDTRVTGLAPSDAFTGDVGVFVGRDVVVFKQGAANIRSFPAKELGEGSLTRGKVLDWAESYGWIFVAVATFGFAVAYYLGMLLGLLATVTVLSALAMLLARLWGVQMRYAEWHASGLHAMTLPLIVQFATAAAGVAIPHVTTALYFLVTVAIIADERARPVPRHEPPAVQGPPAPPAAE